MNILTQTRLLACWVILVCCLITAIFNIQTSTTIVNFITFTATVIVVVVELRRWNRAPCQGYDASSRSITMLGSALVIGVCLVGYMLNTNVVDGFTLSVESDGIPRESSIRRANPYEYEWVAEIASHTVWFISMFVFLCCAWSKRRRIEVHDAH